MNLNRYKIPLTTAKHGDNRNEVFGTAILFFGMLLLIFASMLRGSFKNASKLVLQHKSFDGLDRYNLVFVVVQAFIACPDIP